MEAAATAAAQGASAASKVNASTPTTGTGTPLMIVVTYLLYVQCALIVLLALPYHVPYRKELMQYIHNSPKLWQIRVVFVCINATLGVLLADTFLRLDRTTAQITALQSQHLSGINPGAAPAMDASSHVTSLSELFSSRFRGQRDFYVISFTLFTSTVLYQLHLLLIKLGRYRQERNELRTRLYPSKYPPQQSAAEVVKQRVAGATQAVIDAKDRAINTVAATAADAKNKVVDATSAASQSVSAATQGVSDSFHGKAAAAEGPVVDKTAPVVTPAVTVTPISVVETRKGYVVPAE
ncbi:hypothetical protein HK097_008763 [Rhizophlyctis rosea]|uniref:Endoplasmic reticulum transmembrane protein n=1 Tax=Rhizophlyctis rosea TaxID=64517 RepID=A0AAD5SC08_9FUNG|nr:hypothetical protein HK097_008763 [Rhizophlyctis rosea]